MNNVLEFYLKLKDMMSSGLVKMAKTAKDSFGNATNAAKRTQEATDQVKKSNDILSLSYETLKNKARQLETTIRTSTVVSQIRAARQELANVNRDLKNHIGNTDTGSNFFGGLLKRFAPVAMGGAILASASSFAQASAQQYMNFEANNKSYEILAGNKGVGRALAGDLNTLKQETILGPSVYQNAKTMMSFGITADKVIDNLKMLGEVSMGDADRLASLTLAFSQTQSAGKLMGQDLLQYVNAGFNPLHEISVMTGKSMSVLRKEMENGAISSQMVTKAFEHATSKGGLFYNMLNDMSETTSGKLAAMHGKVAALQIAFGERFAPAMGKSLDVTNKFITSLKHWIEISPVKKLDEEISKIRGLQYELTAANTTRERQLEIFRELEQINPNLVKGISEQSIEYGKLAENINNVTTALQNKKLVEIINDKNGDFLQSYALYQKKQQDDLASISQLMGMVGDDRLLDPNKSFGEKQALAQHILKQRISKDGKDEDAVTYSRLLSTIRDYNTSQQYLDYNKKRFSDIQSQISGAKKIYEQMTGVKSMSATDLQNKGTGSKTTSSEAESVGKSVASGGPRVININGVKFMDKLELHAATVKEGTDEIEKRLEEMFLRILNSGAKIQ